jgi:hypothetical protein
MKKITFIKSMLLAVILLVGSGSVCGQSYLGLDGGLEGSASIDNTNTYSAGQASMWSKTNSSQSISKENTLVRSGGYSLKLNNSTTTGRRCYTPTFSPTSGQRLVMQYYRRVANTTNTQQSHCEISRSGTTASMAAQYQHIQYLVH